ncbi:SAM hydrolase/SAM-dependent halogenase family protein [Protofrankia symbiont of Coriaria ruscifolia]|uniref:SAM hydrolase/SAM-dependent halogenase family protein n=1 Tax=Protofrankia symbiont of Coriaria ruscifolia TaxID=1306542 RepID=UPI00104193CA|nr:SAM-dependent chlorinase/fluorinase [Protofrankia symbiont of Coriaria ruscifolia]
MGYVSFLTDYGLADGFVAACHGVLLRHAPGVHVIDISHLVPAGDVRRGSVVLAQTVGHLPVAVHLAVVDPGVGTSRRALVVSTPRGVLVGPDNGLLPPAADVLGGVRSAVALAVPHGVPATFHGRDVFAPAAAAVATGRDPDSLGEPVDPRRLVRLTPPVARLVDARLVDARLADDRLVDARPADDRLAGARAAGAGPVDGDRHGTTAVEKVAETEVLTVDTYGNVQLAADAALLASAGMRPGRMVRIAVGALVATVLFGVTFSSVSPGELVVYVDAAGLMALAVNRGSAAERLAVTAGDLLRLAAVRPSHS